MRDNFDDCALSLVDKAVDSTQIEQQAHAHAFVDRQDAVKMACLVDVHGGEGFVHNAPFRVGLLPLSLICRAPVASLGEEKRYVEY